MKTTRLLAMMLAGTGSAAFAASGVQGQETGLMVYFFIVFFALIVVSQLLPTALLFVGMVRGLFARTEKISAHEDQA
jgi:hypothetical protein